MIAALFLLVYRLHNFFLKLFLLHQSFDHIGHCTIQILFCDEFRRTNFESYHWIEVGSFDWSYLSYDVKWHHQHRTYHWYWTHVGMQSAYWTDHVFFHAESSSILDEKTCWKDLVSHEMTQKYSVESIEILTFFLAVDLFYLLCDSLHCKYFFINFINFFPQSFLFFLYFSHSSL